MSNLTRSRKSRVAAILATAAVSMGLVAGPASAQPVVTGGLVNVTITNVANNNDVTVQVPISAAANICGVDVLSLSPGDNITCEAGSASDARNTRGNGNGA